MEANETTEDPQATTGAKERSSLKNPSAEDLREPTSPDSPLELSSSQTSSQPPATDTLFLTSLSPNPETEVSEDLQEPSVSGSTLKSHSTRLPSESPQGSSASLLNSPQSVTSLEKAITEIPLEDATDEIHFSKVRNNPLQLSQKDVPASSRRLYSDAGPRTQVPESEQSPKYSFAGPSTQDNVDASAKWEETEEDELTVGTSDVTARAAKPEPHASKKKEKRVGSSCSCLPLVPVTLALSVTDPGRGGGAGLLLPMAPLSFKVLSLAPGYSALVFPGYTSRPAVPAKRAELTNVAKPVNREQFGAGVKNLFQWEKDSALKAIQTGEPWWPSRAL